VARFVALTGSSTAQAAFMLEATHGDMEQAVQMYLGEWLLHTHMACPVQQLPPCWPHCVGVLTASEPCPCELPACCLAYRQADSHQPAAPPRQPDGSGLRQRAAATNRTPAAAGGVGRGGAAAAGPAQPRRRGGPPGLLGLPIKLVASGIHVMSSVVQLTFSLAGMMGDKVLPASVMRAARGGWGPVPVLCPPRLGHGAPGFQLLFLSATQVTAYLVCCTHHPH
jgi:FAS-associated factor 2